MTLTSRSRLYLALLLGLAAVVSSSTRAEPVQQVREFVPNVGFDGVDVSPGDGICSITNNPQLPKYCTLRAAIMEGNAQPSTVDVRVTLLPSMIYTLGIPGRSETHAKTGDLNVKRPMRIGPVKGAPRATVDAGGHDRAFSISTAQGVVTLYGLEITGAPWIDGAAVMVWSGGVGIDASDIHHNAVNLYEGGTASVVEGAAATTVAISNSHLHRNGMPTRIATVLYVRGTSIVERTLIASNDARGAYVLPGGDLTMRSSTVTGNSGGFFLSGAADIEHTTIVDNRGGQIAFLGKTAAVRLINSIVSGHPNCNARKPGVVFTTRYNVYSGGTCISDVFVDHSQHNTDPLLHPLADWGGPTWTMKPKAGSPAIDFSPSLLCDEDPFDQRGMPRPKAYKSGLAPRCDAGAVELPTALVMDPDEPVPPDTDAFVNGFSSGFEFP